MTNRWDLRKLVKMNLSRIYTRYIRRVVVLFLSAGLLLNTGGRVYSVYAKDLMSPEYEVKTYRSKKEFTKGKYDSAILTNTLEKTVRLKKACVIVNVKIMCDKEYQRLHKEDWKVRVKSIVNKGVEKLYSKFNIYLFPKKAVSYNSVNSYDAGVLLQKFAQKYKTTKKINMIIGFSGKKPQHIAGIAYVGKVAGGPRMLVFASTYATEAETVQHEIGHVYNLGHCVKNCVMTCEGFGYLNKFCSDHSKQWKKNRTYYQ